MAKPISTVEPGPGPTAVRGSPEATAEAEFRRLLVLAHERGALQLIGGFLEDPDASLGTATDWMSRPGNLQVVKHALLFYETLRSIDPRAVQILLNGLNGAAAGAASPDDGRALGFWGLLRALRDPDVNRGLRFMLRMAGGLGRSLARPKP